MANSDPNSAPLNKTFKVLVSFFVAATAESSNARIASFRQASVRSNAAIYKEKLMLRYTTNTKL